MTSDYSPPVADVMRSLDLVGLGDVLALDSYAGLEREDIQGLLHDVGQLAAEVIAPTNRIGDEVGSVLDPASGRVTTPPGFHEAYGKYQAGGWQSLDGAMDVGGGGLPKVVAFASNEFLTSANLALSLNAMLTHGATELLERWGNQRQRQLFLRRLVSGEWSGTMNLTEPQAGSDVGAVRTSAVRDEDGTWRISGTKIYITWGEHDLTDNILHLVLARTPGAPAGTKGLSLFLVPKVLVDDEGVLGEHNSVRALSLEHKVGIHASPTCVLEFDRAAGELVGEELGGIAGMFTMMNSARLHVAQEGLAVTERSYQQALAHARTRVQGGGPIAAHPDVRRMLAVMRTTAVGMRHLLLSAAVASDLARHAATPEERELARERQDLLVPIAKAWCTDQGVAMTSLGIQVCGGMGYVEETGVAQHWRDSRIAPIYEGTNGIQAIDLVERKVRRDSGAGMTRLLEEVTATVDALLAAGVDASALSRSADVLAECTAWLVAQPRGADVLAGATSYLELAGTVVSGWLLGRAALSGDADDLQLFGFAASELLPRVYGLPAPVTAGAGRLPEFV